MNYQDVDKMRLSERYRLADRLIECVAENLERQYYQELKNTQAATNGMERTGRGNSIPDDSGDRNPD